MCAVPTAPLAGEPSARELAQAVSEATADLAEEVAPTTVYIQVDKGPGMTSGLEQLMRDYDLPRMEEPTRGVQSSSGSGVIVREDGLVLTNHHVVSGSTVILVTLRDQRRLPAKVLGSDPRTDVAVLQLLGEGPFPAAQVGDSDQVRVGARVLTVGHPFDFTFTVTAGIVSARGRRNLVDEEIHDFIQTDAAIAPGSSGGPLFSLSGELVGINTAIYSPTAESTGSTGIAFAIPSNMAMRVASELLETGRVSQASIGVSSVDRPPSPEEPRPGAELTGLISGGPAEKAGLQVGDVVEAVNDDPVISARDLRAVILAQGTGAEVSLRVRRQDEQVTVVLSTVDDRALAGVGLTEDTLPEGAFEWAGLTLVAATPELLEARGVALPDEMDGTGLLVLAADATGAATKAGLTAGDLLVEVQKKPIPHAAAFLSVVDGRRTAMVRFWRGEGFSYAAVAGLRDAD